MDEQGLLKDSLDDRSPFGSVDSLLEKCPKQNPRRAELYVLRGALRAWESGLRDFLEALKLVPPGHPGRKRILLRSGYVAVEFYRQHFQGRLGHGALYCNRDSAAYAHQAAKSLAKVLDLDISDEEHGRCLDALSLLEWEMYAQGIHENANRLQDGIKHRLEANKLGSFPAFAPRGVSEAMLAFLTSKTPQNESEYSMVSESVEACLTYARGPSEAAQLRIWLAFHGRPCLKLTHLTSAFHLDPSIVRGEVIQIEIPSMITHWEQEYSRTKDASVIDFVLSACAAMDRNVHSPACVRVRTSSSISGYIGRIGPG